MTGEAEKCKGEVGQGDEERVNRRVRCRIGYKTFSEPLP